MFIKTTETKKIRGTNITDESPVILNTALIKFIYESSKTTSLVVYDNDMGLQVMIPYQELADLLSAN
jgi:hypothetical protein